MSETTIPEPPVGYRLRKAGEIQTWSDLLFDTDENEWGPNLSVSDAPLIEQYLEDYPLATREPDVFPFFVNWPQIPFGWRLRRAGEIETLEDYWWRANPEHGDLAGWTQNTEVTLHTLPLTAQNLENEPVITREPEPAEATQTLAQVIPAQPFDLENPAIPSGWRERRVGEQNTLGDYYRTRAGGDWVAEDGATLQINPLTELDLEEFSIITREPAQPDWRADLDPSVTGDNIPTTPPPAGFRILRNGEPIPGRSLRWVCRMREWGGDFTSKEPRDPTWTQGHYPTASPLLQYAAPIPETSTQTQPMETAAVSDHPPIDIGAFRNNFDAPFRSLLDQHPNHPMIRAHFSQYGPLPETAPASVEEWAAWYYQATGSPRPRTGRTVPPVTGAAARIAATAAPRTNRVFVTVYESGTEHGTCTWTGSASREYRIEIPEEVLREAAEEDDPSVISEWVSDNYTNGDLRSEDSGGVDEYDNYDTDGYSADDHEVDESCVDDAFDAARDRFGD